MHDFLVTVTFLSFPTFYELKNSIYRLFQESLGGFIYIAMQQLDNVSFSATAASIVTPRRGCPHFEQ